jgi:hypothetical protein
MRTEIEAAREIVRILNASLLTALRSTAIFLTELGRSDVLSSSLRTNSSSSARAVSTLILCAGKNAMSLFLAKNFFVSLI